MSDSNSNSPLATNTAASSQPPSAAAQGKRKTNLPVLALALSIAGSGLIWYKLRVVTGVPRQAIADPEHRPQPKPNSPPPLAPTEQKETHGQKPVGP